MGARDLQFGHTVATCMAGTSSKSSSQDLTLVLWWFLREEGPSMPSAYGVKPEASNFLQQPAQPEHGSMVGRWVADGVLEILNWPQARPEHGSMLRRSVADMVLEIFSWPCAL